MLLSLKAVPVRQGAGPALTALAAIVLLPIGVSFGAPDSPDPVFSKDVLPILERKCFQCHGDGQKVSDLDLSSRTGMLEGGVHGPALVPGDAQQSPLYLRVSGMEAPVMPMGGSLSDEEIWVLRDWIDQGAKWDGPETEPDSPATPAATTPRASVPEIEITEEDRRWWAFQQPARHPVPQVGDPRWKAHPIDAFIKDRLESEGLSPAATADKRTLIRRAYLDLIGIIPLPEEVDAFVRDGSLDSFEKVIDRLLASPHYGERWGRHWLDVARYADSHGYEHDFDYPNAWRYRDYVIRAFNEDKPYDQFVREQLAGDELDEVTFDSLIATGFHRVGPRVGFREKDNPQYRYEYLDDMIGTTGRAFMALTVNCARCHDHKFDPIPQVDYYRMMAVFFPFVKYDYPLVPRGEESAYQTRKAALEAEIEPLKVRLAEIEDPYREAAFEKMMAELPEDIQEALRTPESERTPGQKLLAEQVLTFRVNDVSGLLNDTDRAAVREIKDHIEKLQENLRDAVPMAMGIRDGDYRFAPDGRGDKPLPGKGNREVYDVEGTFLPEPGKPYNPPKTYFLPTGDYHTKGPEVQPGFLQVVTAGDPPTARPSSSGHISTGRCRALADWIASPDHPLTSRVMINRIWQHHFGKGIVATAANFGRTGQRPTHPKLLDWLATEFVRQGWSIKQMQRLIMTSQTYRMASDYHRETNAEADPDNSLLWRFPQRRLEGEAIRDNVLAAGGNLNLARGGKPFFPPVPESVWRSSGKGKWVLTEQGPAVWRRSIYSYWKRGLRYPMFDVFDQPDPNVTCERRNTTTVPTQALTLLNNEFVLLQAGYFAKRVEREAGHDPPLAITEAYRIALSRQPTPKELAANVSFLARQKTYHQSRGDESPGLAALTDLCDVIFNLNEFVYMN